MRSLTLFIMVSCMLSTSSRAHAGIRISVDGEWLFAVDSLNVGLTQGWYGEGITRSGWQRVQTPKFWEEYPGMADYDGSGWFAKTVRIGKIPGPISLHFAGVDDDAVVWVNGREVGSHSGYSAPFAVDVSGALREGENLIVVLVRDYSGGGGIYRPITLIETSALDELLRSPFADMKAVKSAPWVSEAVVYSVYLRSFSKEGNFAGLEKRIPELKDLGATVLWLMPIHPVGVKNRKGTLGSPYAVSDYYGINPEFGTMKDFKKLLRTVHKEGMKIIIDLVANHTSWDSKLIVEHPGWFTKDARGKIVPPNTDWTDVADLDYSNPELRKYMLDMMVWWVREVGIDGFRCDVAEMVPTDFWEQAREKLEAVKPVMMLSEGSLPEHHVKAFDLTYSWNVYDALAPLIQGKRPVVLIDQILKNEQLQFPSGSLRMRFATNHDKNAWDTPAVEKFGRKGVKLAAVLVNTLPGIPMIYTGEEVANDRKLSLFEKVEVDWSRPRDVGELYRTLFRLRREHPALVGGEMVRVEGQDGGGVYAFWRRAGNDRVLVVLNFASSNRKVTLTPGEKVGRYRGVFSPVDVTIPREGSPSEVSLPPLGFEVFEVRD